VNKEQRTKRKGKREIMARVRDVAGNRYLIWKNGGEI